MKNNAIQEKSYKFSLHIIEMYKILINDKKEFIISKQLLRCGTSIGANVEEAIGGLSFKEFIAKLSISYKEAREARYWIKLLINSDILKENDMNSLLREITEICRILGKILATSTKKIKAT